MLIAARASMGVGGALMMPSTLSIITDMFRDSGERQRAIGLWAATSGVSIALGPIVGGVLLSRFWWGSVFLINVPVAVAGIACAIPLVPDSRNPAARRPDLTGSVLSVAGLGLLLWSIIEAPARGWSSGLVIASGLGALTVLGGFALWERASDHPMLNLRFFQKRAFSAAISSVWLVTFGMYGALFVLTQYLQFSLGYTALQTGIRVLPAAAAVAVVAPASPFLVRLIGTRFTAAAGLLVVAAGLWQISGASVTSTYADSVAGMVMLGIGAGLAIPCTTASVMGSVPRGDTGVGSATNGTFMQVGGALGVAVIGSVLSTRFTGRMTSTLAPYHLPQAAEGRILGSVGGALGVAARVGGSTGALLAHAARVAFISGMDLGLAIGAAAPWSAPSSRWPRSPPGRAPPPAARPEPAAPPAARIHPATRIPPATPIPPATRIPRPRRSSEPAGLGPGQPQGQRRPSPQGAARGRPGGGHRNPAGAGRHRAVLPAHRAAARLPR